MEWLPWIYRRIHQLSLLCHQSDRGYCKLSSQRQSNQIARRIWCWQISNPTQLKQFFVFCKSDSYVSEHKMGSYSTDEILFSSPKRWRTEWKFTLLHRHTHAGSISLLKAQLTDHHIHLLQTQTLYYMYRSICGHITLSSPL